MLISMNYNEGNAKRKKRELILKKSCALMSKHSLEKVTMIDIAKAAKIQRRTLYHYYNSKDKILHDVMINCMNNLYDAYFGAEISKALNQYERLRILLIQFIKAAKEKPETVMYISNYKNYFITEPEYNLFFESFIRDQLIAEGEEPVSDGSIKVPADIDFMDFTKLVISSCLAVAFNAVQSQLFVPNKDHTFSPKHLEIMFNLALTSLKA